MSTLSVETSSSASSTATESPTFLSQRVTVPSLTLSPRAGIVITVPAVTGTTGATGSGITTGATSTTGAGIATGSGITTGATGAGVTASAVSAITASSAPTGTV